MTETMTEVMTEDMPSIKDALNEYFRLKSKFESQNAALKKKIMNNTSFSNKEKRAQYLKLMPKCVNCKRPSRVGTIFSVKLNPATDKSDAYRIFKCGCGDLANPCNLNIEINVGIVEPIDKLMNDIRNEINEAKNKIIDDKNKLLFGLITTEAALENFDVNKTYINELTSVYANYLDQYTNIVDNPQKKIELEESTVSLYNSISKIKECIKKMNENNDEQFAYDAASIYNTTVEPLLQKIRQLKFSEFSVFNDETNNTCNLIQRANLIEDLLVSGYTSKVVSYDIGLKLTSKKKKTGALIIEDSSEETPRIMINQGNKPSTDEPIIGQGKDGIAWKNPEYQKLWDNLPDKLKAEFKLNIPWMKDFMNNCVSKRMEGKDTQCSLTTPPNIILPPKEMSNGQYDFGVTIYNKVFNGLPKSLQSTYLTFYKEDPTTKEKSYKSLEDALNTLVEKEAGFGRGFF